MDVMIFAMLIASAVSLLVISPRHAQREALRALRDDSETESLPTVVVNTRLSGQCARKRISWND